jgi:GNAT superfamily N-acetyltransferase
MKELPRNRPSRGLQQLAGAALDRLPRETRFALYRRMVDCNASPDIRLSLGIAATQPDLEACFALLHDAYVCSGFMRPDPSGLRVTPYHSLPTTTTLYARFDGQIVGTLSIIREGVFGFPMQSVFDLTAVRAQPGRIAEISALAIHPQFRNTGGTILFPLMKFMYEYCTKYFDTRHLVIAVNPKHIEMYESLLFFQRMQAQDVEKYDFVNGAPAVGATLDLIAAPEIFQAAYGERRLERNLHHYFTQVKLPNIQFPKRPYYTTNDPVMSPALLDYFFNQRTRGFERLDDRQRCLLHAIYPEDSYRSVLPHAPQLQDDYPTLRRHRRYSLKCPAQMEVIQSGLHTLVFEVIDVSLSGFLARTATALPSNLRGIVQVQLGDGQVATEEAVAVRCVNSASGPYYGFCIDSPTLTWQQCISDLERQHAPPGALSRHVFEANDAREDWSVHDAIIA